MSFREILKKFRVYMNKKMRILKLNKRYQHKSYLFHKKSKR